MPQVYIRTGNAAFDDGNREREIARILRKLADRIEADDPPEFLMDYNGNKVGTYRAGRPESHHGKRETRR